MRRHFHAVRVSRAGWPDAPADRSVIVYGNHPSWWDPLLYILLAGTVLRGRIGFGVMDAAMLERYGVFRRLGVFGVGPDARGSARFLRTGAALLADERHALFVTPQGRFTDVRTRPLGLRPGVAHLALRATRAVALPVATEYVFWNESKPEILVRFGTPVHVTGGADAAGAMLEDALAATMDALAEESRARDPAAFSTLLSSRTGVGGVYELWGRARSLARGKRFQASHEPGA